MAVSTVHAGDPNGRSRRIDSLTVSSSTSALAALTLSTHSLPRGSVPGSSQTGERYRAKSERRLDRGQMEWQNALLLRNIRRESANTE
jgi:hypothetical protein